MKKPMTETETPPRAVWAAPAVRKLSAGSAEDGASKVFDGAQPS